MTERSKKDYKDYYELKDIIASGGYGIVYKGREKITNEFRAIKVMNIEKIKISLLYQYDRDKIEEQLKLCIEGFINEFNYMKICSNKNDNSVKCYEYFNNKENFVIIMELCDQNLEQLLNKKFEIDNKGFNPKEIYEMMKELNNTFKIMEKNKIIHRDLKLENILIKYDDEEHRKYTLKLSDYGCSKRLESLSKYCNTYAGTLAYMSPEILKEEEYNYKSDLWSIGIIIYRLIFGNSPYRGATEKAILSNINNFGKKLLRETENEDLNDLISKLLEKDPLKRISWEDYFNHPFFKIENKKQIRLIYYAKQDEINEIFGKKFVEKNKNNIELIINETKKELVDKYLLKKGENIIKIIIKNEINDLEDMFLWCSTLKNIDGLKYLNTKKINNFSYMFYGCSLLSNIKALENWDVSNGNNFSSMFYGCSLLSDIKPLEKWKVSNGNNFSGMFHGCSFLSNIKSLNKWNVSNGNNFSGIFNGCSLLSDIKSLEKWKVLNGNNFSGMFNGCSSLSDIKPLGEWNVSKGENFSHMFHGCSLLSDIKVLKNWKVLKGNNFSGMFKGCSLLSDIKSLEEWNVSNGNNFSCMFNYCSILSDIKPLKNWNVSNGNNFSFMFGECLLLSDIKSLENWSVSNGNNFSGIFFLCKSLSDINSLIKKWEKKVNKKLYIY